MPEGGYPGGPVPTDSPPPKPRAYVNPGHAQLNWHNAVKGCPDCEFERIWRHARSMGIGVAAWGPTEFANDLIAWMDNQNWRASHDRPDA